MTQPLDFSRGTQKVAAPAPPPPKGRGGLKRVLVVLLAVALLAGAAFLALKVIKGGDSAAEQAGAGAQYCQLAAQLEQVSLATGAASPSGAYDGSPEKIKAATDLLGASLRQLRSVAPGAVKDDVRTVTTGLERAATGDRSRITAPSFAKAVERLNSHRSTTCKAGSGNGEGRTD